MSGNGADIGQVLAMLRDVLVVQNETRNEVRAQGRKLDDLANQVTGLRQAVDDYHHAVIGHGVLIGELDERVGRLERHEPPPEAA
ncbi:MAG: biogenesis of lysosome-related organelles complex 1 subunit 2 [Pseudomonadota bacterium]|nr:biogenesis of lysosome-related organelles complex 1 subunit 2 [Pseudomonadota bacterium]